MNPEQQEQLINRELHKAVEPLGLEDPGAAVERLRPHSQVIELKALVPGQESAFDVRVRMPGDGGTTRYLPPAAAIEALGLKPVEHKPTPAPPKPHEMGTREYIEARNARLGRTPGGRPGMPRFG